MARLISILIASVSISGYGKTLYDLEAVDIDGKMVSLADLKGKVSVIMNVATLWGFTASNYAMLQRLQQEYVEQPVRFLLFPCNQFAAQEPGSNAEIKAFAETYIKLGPGSNVIMFAKSNLNNVTCAARGTDLCAPFSATCCPTNDAIYEYLLSATPPGRIKWNFDKIIVDASGKPFPGETIFHGEALDAVLGAAIAHASTALAVTQTSSERQPFYHAAILLVAIMGFAIAATILQPWKRQQQQDYIRLV